MGVGRKETLTDNLLYSEIRPYNISQYNSSLLSLPGANLFQRGKGGGGCLFDLEQTMVSVLHKKLEYRVEKLKYEKLELKQPRIKIKSELPVGE